MLQEDKGRQSFCRNKGETDQGTKICGSLELSEQRQTRPRGRALHQVSDHTCRTARKRKRGSRALAGQRETEVWPPHLFKGKDTMCGRLMQAGKKHPVLLGSILPEGEIPGVHVRG